MAKHRRRTGRPRAVRKVRIHVMRRPEDAIDRHALALALLAFHRQIIQLEQSAPSGCAPPTHRH